MYFAYIFADVLVLFNFHEATILLNINIVNCVMFWTCKRLHLKGQHIKILISKIVKVFLCCDTKLHSHCVLMFCHMLSLVCVMVSTICYITFSRCQCCYSECIISS